MKRFLPLFLFLLPCTGYSYPYLYGRCTYTGTLPYWQVEYYTIEVEGKTCETATDEEVQNFSNWRDTKTRKMKNSASMAFNWKDSNPDELGLHHPDCFGIIGSTFLHLEEDKTYTFCAQVDDGVILYVDGISHPFKMGTEPCWSAKGLRECRTDPVFLSRGYHYIEVRYFEKTGNAQFTLGAKEGSPSTCSGAYPLTFTSIIAPGVRGEYYADTIPGGFNQFVATSWEDMIDHQWGESSPPGVPENYFSTRFATYLLIRKAGKYKFCFQYDDAIKVWLNGTLVYSDWRTGTLKEYSLPELPFVTGLHELVIEHFEADGNATLRAGYGKNCNGDVSDFTSIPEDMFAYIGFECLKVVEEEGLLPGCSSTGGWKGVFPLALILLYPFLMRTFWIRREKA